MHIDAKYANWIAEQTQPVYRRCEAATQEMVDAFPELRRVRGHYFDGHHDHPHWWCVAPDGSVIDPTAAQFSAIGFYEEWDKPEPTGKCPNCGGYVFDSGTVCSDQCARQYEAYCLRGW